MDESFHLIVSNLSHQKKPTIVGFFNENIYVLGKMTPHLWSEEMAQLLKFIPPIGTVE